MLKSLIYSQKRFHCQSSVCCSHDLCTRRPCVKIQPRKPIKFHFLTDAKSEMYITELMKNWDLENITYHTYDYLPYISDLSWVKSSHPAKSKPLIKLRLNRFLDESIKKVIVIDTDMILNANIEDLWNEFDKFNPNQMIGMVIEQNPYFQDNMCSRFWPNMRYGYNGGVVLLRLDLQRNVRWDNEWQQVARTLLRNLTTLPTLEQDILNGVLSRNKQILYEIPCEWNIQVSDGVHTRRCPVNWLTENYLLENSHTSRLKSFKIIHCNRYSKAEDIISVGTGLDSTANYSKDAQNEWQLFKIYQTEYYKLRSVFLPCFV